MARTVTTTSHLDLPVTIRLATGDDQRALAQLAALDSADSLPHDSALLAVVAGELRAALSLHDGSTIADPFYPTAHLVDLLRAHAEDRATPRNPRRARGARHGRHRGSEQWGALPGPVSAET
ncbi:MAG: hypothetical protein JO372_12635 [Solirubrobacterales bacterium]|nr:hypothetical protein [Solirubrobacterales bacterium]